MVVCHRCAMRRHVVPQAQSNDSTNDEIVNGLSAANLAAAIANPTGPEARLVRDAMLKLADKSGLMEMLKSKHTAAAGGEVGLDVGGIGEIVNEGMAMLGDAQGMVDTIVGVSELTLEANITVEVGVEFNPQAQQRTESAEKGGANEERDEVAEGDNARAAALLRAKLKLIEELFTKLLRFEKTSAKISCEVHRRLACLMVWEMEGC